MSQIIDLAAGRCLHPGQGLCRPGGNAARRHHGSRAQNPWASAEIFFAHLDQARSQQLFGDHNFVFSGELKHMMGLAKVMADQSEIK